MATRPPAWFYFTAASYLTYACLLVYSNFYPPAPVGVDFEQGAGVRTISYVVPASPADRAGLRIGDRVVEIDGWPMDGPTGWISRAITTEVDRPARWVVDRPRSDSTGRRQRVAVDVASQGRALQSGSVPLVVVAVVSGALGLLILARRPHDRRALLGGAMLIAFGAQPLSPPRGFLALWRGLPFLLGLLIWPLMLTAVLAPLLFFLFCAVFPRRTVPWSVIVAAVVAWLPMTIVVVPLVIIYIDPAARPRYTPSMIVGMAILDLLSVAGGAFLLTRAVRRLTDLNEQRRIRTLLAGMSVGALAIANAVAAAVADEFQVPVLIRGFLAWTRPLSPYLFLAVPIAFAHAILRHRVFDVGVSIRLGLQYVLARGVLLSIVPGMLVVLLIDLQMHASDPLNVTLASRGWIYALVIAAAIIANMKRGRWASALDRQFFRDRYESERLLREIAEDVRRAPAFEIGAQEVARRIERALHPAFVAVFVRGADAAAFSTLLSIPAGHRFTLQRDSRLAGLIRVLTAPVDLSTTGWAARQLPGADLEPLQREGADLLVPIVVGIDRREAILVLGRKRSEEPYSRQDRELLGAIASNLAVLLERPVQPGAEAPGLGSRYTVLQRLGEGGMGTVYEALDIELQRTVAIKVIRQDASADPTFAQRFKQEALSAAAFAHPNVVSIYDFGVSPDGRMFIVMERLHGRTLRDELRAHGRLSPSRAVHVVSGISAAADAAHRRKIVHRDLKPENVFLALDGSLETIKVVDFGIARATAPVRGSAVTATGQIVGTLAYMAPEQISGARATTAADLWALAVIAYESLTARHPFEGELGFEWQRAALGRFTPVDTDENGRLTAFFTRAFAARPDQRYPDATALAAEFAAIVAAG